MKPAPPQIVVTHLPKHMTARDFMRLFTEKQTEVWLSQERITQEAAMAAGEGDDNIGITKKRNFD